MQDPAARRVRRLLHLTGDRKPPRPDESGLRVALTGGSGLVGTSLCPFLSALGHEVRRLSRTSRDPAEGLLWNPASGRLSEEASDNLDAVVHLAGANIASSRWTARRKEVLRESRIGTTHRLCTHLANHPHPPRTLVCASAVGYYGDRGEEELKEESQAGAGFLSALCQAWEASTRTASESGIRVVHLRIGVVLAPEGGALARMRLPFRLGLGGPLGSGRQFISWIGLGDLLRVIAGCVEDPTMEGPVNAVAPCPVRSREFARNLGKTLGRPAVLPVPAFVLKTLLGELGKELLLSSTRVLPEVLTQRGFRFFWPTLCEALEWEFSLASNRCS